MKRSELLYKLNNIQMSIDEIQGHAMLQEGKFDAVKIFFTRGWQVLKGTVGKHPEVITQLKNKIAAGQAGMRQVEQFLANIAKQYGKNSMTYKRAAYLFSQRINTTGIIPEMEAAASQLNSYYKAVKYTRIAEGTIAVGTAGGVAYAYNKLASPPVDEELPSTETVMAATMLTSDDVNIESEPIPESEPVAIPEEPAPDISVEPKESIPETKPEEVPEESIPEPKPEVISEQPIPETNNQKPVTDQKSVQDKVKNLNALERLWNSIKEHGKKFKIDVEKMINNTSNDLNANPIALSLSGFLLALLIMFAGVMIYYINVGGNIGDSIKQAFQNAIDKVRNSSGSGESLINIVMIPANIALGFITQSPLGSIIFAFGICVFMFMSIVTLAGWDAIRLGAKKKGTKITQA